MRSDILEIYANAVFSSLRAFGRWVKGLLLTIDYTLRIKENGKGRTEHGNRIAGPVPGSGSQINES